jgi:hypothetical protein
MKDLHPIALCVVPRLGRDNHFATARLDIDQKWRFASHIASRLRGGGALG